MTLTPEQETQIRVLVKMAESLVARVNMGITDHTLCQDAAWVIECTQKVRGIMGMESY